MINLKVIISSNEKNVKSDSTQNAIRISHSKNPVARTSNKAHWGMINRTLSTQELTELIESGHALGAIVRGRHVAENFIARGDIQVDMDNASLESVLNSDFYKRYGYLIYTTRTEGHFRVMFRLSRQINNKLEYKQLAAALTDYLGGDSSAVSATQLWYTAKGSQVFVNGATIPVGVIEDMVPDVTVSDMVQRAVEAVSVGRNEAGFRLALSLKRSKVDYDTAAECLAEYQKSVANSGRHPYTLSEAMSSLKSAYSMNEGGRGLYGIDILKVAAITNVLDISVNVTRTLFAILDTMSKLGLAQDVALGMNQISAVTEYHVDKSTISRHIPVLVEAGVLSVKNNGKGKAFTYSIIVPAWVVNEVGGEKVGEVEAVEFDKLQNRAFTESGARIRLEEAMNDDEVLSHFGPSAQRIVAALAARPEGISSQKELIEITELSERCIRTTVKSLIDQGIIVTDKNWKTVTMKLSKFAAEIIDELELRLTSHGKSAKREISHMTAKIMYAVFVINNAQSSKRVSKAIRTLNEAEARIEFLTS